MHWAATGRGCEWVVMSVVMMAVVMVLVKSLVVIMVTVMVMEMVESVVMVVVMTSYFFMPACSAVRPSIFRTKLTSHVSLANPS